MTSLMPWERPGSKIDDRHLQRLAVIYVRQSTRQQLVDHQESTRLQYALVDRAVALGWQADRVLVIDEDLGKSGSSAVARTGFQRLVTEIGLDHVGLVLGIEMSRLARSGRDWYQLIELCALSGAVLADTDGVYDPGECNDNRWWPEIAAFIDTGHHNAKSEGINRVIKLVARAAFGFRNAESQRLRTRSVTTRRARGHLRTAQL